MAQIIDSFDFPSDVSTGSRPRYPWGEWLDGQIRVLVKGTDFAAQVMNMTTSLKLQAKYRNRTALVAHSTLDDGSMTITVQAVNLDKTPINPPSVIEAVKPAKPTKAAAATPAAASDADANADAAVSQ